MNVGDFRGNRMPVLQATAVDDTVQRPKQVYLYQ
jgi:hypothetical protein